MDLLSPSNELSVLATTMVHRFAPCHLPTAYTRLLTMMMGTGEIVFGDVILNQPPSFILREQALSIEMAFEPFVFR